MKMTFISSMRLALEHCLEMNANGMLFGLGVGDVGGVFGSTLGLQDKFGKERVFETPLSENAITGMALGLSMQGFHPIMVHQRADFTFTAAEQLINQIAKLNFTTNNQFSAPLIIRMIIGRGWGQGPTHAQSPHSLYASVPGLTIVAPATPSDCYNLMLMAASSSSPILFLEHRWLHQTSETFEPNSWKSDRGGAKILLSGTDLTLLSLSYGVLECISIAKVLAEFGVSCEVINLRSIKPLDVETILRSAKKTKRVVSWDIGHKLFGLAGEISILLNSESGASLMAPLLSFGLPDEPTPSSPFLAAHHYVDRDMALNSISEHFNLKLDIDLLQSKRQSIWPYKSEFRDQPDIGEVGPF